MSKSSKLIVGFFALLALAMAGWAWKERNRANVAEETVNTNAAIMLREIFTAKRELKVGRLSGFVVARTQYNGRVFKPIQETKAPVSIDYTVDMNKISNKDIYWNKQSRELVIFIPDVVVDKPNIDFINSYVKQEGIWIGREVGIAMQRDVIKKITARANERARDPKNIANARQEAQKFVRDLIRRPLSAIGYDDIRIRVRFSWERGGERWDVSRSLEEVLGNRT